MKKKILIIRSISMQQLDNLMSKLYTEYPEDDLYILTHSHAIKRCEKYKNITEIIDYERINNFSIFHIPKNINEHDFDIIIIPVTNISGVGFFNVFLMSLRIKSKKLFLYNLQSKKKERKKREIIFNFFKSILFSTISIFVTIILSPFIISHLLISKIITK